MQENFVTVAGNRIRYLESGDSAHTLVLVHGLGASAERWNSVLSLFADKYRVLAPDIVGFGHSDKPITDYTTEFLSEFLAQFIDVLGLESTHVIGSSMGGQLALELAHSRPDLVKKLILTSPSGIMKQSTPALDAYILAALYPNSANARTAFELMEHSGNTVKDHIVQEFVVRMKLPNAKMAFMSTLLGLKNARPVDSILQDIAAPTMLIWGAEDPVIPIHYSDTFVSLIPQCTFHIMDGCGHTPFVQSPKKFTKLVFDFLA